LAASAVSLSSFLAANSNPCSGVTASPAAIAASQAACNVANCELTVLYAVVAAARAVCKAPNVPPPPLLPLSYAATNL